MESMAAHVHDLWAESRLEEGWLPGSDLDRSRRIHPSLVPYTDLPEEEKEIDRRTARGTLQFILDSGFSLTKTRNAEAGALAARAAADEFLRRIEADPACTSTDLQRCWGEAPRAACAHDVRIYRAGAKCALKISELELCMEIATIGLLHHPNDPGLVEAIAIALLQEGRRREARKRLEPAIAHARKSGASPTEQVELLARLARTYKDKWVETRDEAALAKAISLYREAFELDPQDYYPGINLATLLFLGDRTGEARKMARRVLRILDRDDGPANYWSLATRAEACLVLGRLDEARKALRRAGRATDASWRDRGATAAQAQLLLRQLERRMPSLESLLRLPTVCVLRQTGPPPAGPAETKRSLRMIGKITDLPKGARVAVAGIESIGQVAHLAGSLADFEEYHLVLPCPVEVLQGAAARGKQRPLLDQVINGAASIRITSRQGPADWALSATYLRAVTEGTARLKAEHLGLPCRIIPWLACPDRNATTGAAGADPGLGRLRIGTMEQDIKAILFADVRGYTSQPENRLREFLKLFLGGVSRLVAESESPPVVVNTWGDALFMVFDEVLGAAGFALALESLLKTSLNAAKNGHVDVRTSLHAGPVFAIADPVTRQVGFTGTHVSHAARIEPLVEPGEVWTSQAFAALAIQADPNRFRFHFVGTRNGKGGYGPVDLYRLAPGDLR